MELAAERPIYEGGGATNRVVAPHANTNSAWARFWATKLNDPRDVVFVNLALGTLVTMWPAAALLFYWGEFSWLWAIPYAVLFATWVDRVTLMFHCAMHRPLFGKSYRALNDIVLPWFVGPVFGQTPNSYFVHHMGMHHREGNLPADLSTTMPFQRDRFVDFLKYWGRFMTIGLWDLYRYHARGHRQKMVTRLLVSELSYWAICWILAIFVSWQATLVVFVVPVLVMRTLMMAGNWAQHAFVDPADPKSDFWSSITCLNTRYNRRCFNDGYHIIHHIKPSLHYTEMPLEFEKNQRLYGEHDAIVFDGLDFHQVWWLLMTGNKKELARRFVRLPGAPVRTEQEVIELFERRLRPFPRDWAPAAGTSPAAAATT